MEDRKRAEALLQIIRGWGPSKSIPKILAAFAEERERCAQKLEALPLGDVPVREMRRLTEAIRSAGASAGPAEGLPPAESQGAPTAGAIRAEGTPAPEPLREARMIVCDSSDSPHEGNALCANPRPAFAAAPSAQPQETPSAELNTRTARSADGLPVVDFDRDALRRMPTQASETPAEGEVWDALERELDEAQHLLLSRGPLAAQAGIQLGDVHQHLDRARLLARRPHGR